MHVVTHIPRRRMVSGKRLYLPTERLVVGDYGLGDVDGINLGKMFKRMFTFTSSSFKPKNIAGAIGSVAMTTATMGLAPLIAPKFAGAHSKVAQGVGYGAMAVAAAAAAYYGGGALLKSVGGVGSTAATGTGLVGTAAKSAGFVHPITGAAATASTWSIGGVLSNVGSGLITGVKALTSILPVVGGLVGGSGGQQQQQPQHDAQAEAYYQQQQAAAQEAANRQAQAEYDAYIRAQQQQMYQPGYQEMPGAMPAAYAGQSYGDLRSPYTGTTEDGEVIQFDPNTGQPIQPGMSTEMMIALSAVALGLGAYFMSGNNKTN